jgi:hypothetical protein
MLKHFARFVAVTLTALFVGGIVPLESVEPAHAAGPTKCQPGWSALVHLVVNTTSMDMPASCANTACWPVDWQMVKRYDGQSPLNCWFMGLCPGSGYMYRTMASYPSGWTSLPQCPSSVTAGPWHSP